MNKIINSIKFTSREFDVLSCIIHNRSNKKIAGLLNLSYKTVEVHNRNIMTKIGCNSKDSIIDFIHLHNAYEILQKHYFQNINKGNYLADNPLFKKINFQHKYIYTLIITICIIILGFQIYNRTPKTEAHYDFIIPYSYFLVNKNDIITKIDRVFKTFKSPIRYTILSGISGSGKTITARLYLMKQKAHIAWEINCKTKEDILDSLIALAYKLAKTTQDKDEINFIANLNNIKNKQVQILTFLQNKFKNSNNWALHFDGVSNFKLIEDIMPKNHKTWGKGKIIITTTHNGSYIKTDISNKNIIPLPALTPYESKQMFYSIANNNINEHNADRLLKHIPPYPLDIYIAAKFFQHNIGINASYYINKLKKNCEEFKKFKKTNLKDTDLNTEYTYETRKKSIAYIVKHFIHANIYIKKLLFTLCMYNSKQLDINFIKLFLNNHINDNQLNDVLSTLQNNGLLNVKDNKIILHEMILQIIKENIINNKKIFNKNEISEIIKNLDIVTSKTLKSKNYHNIVQIHKLLFGFYRYLSNYELDNIDLEKLLITITKSLDPYVSHDEQIKWFQEIIAVQNKMKNEYNPNLIYTYRNLAHLYRYNTFDSNLVNNLLNKALSVLNHHKNIKKEAILLYRELSAFYRFSDPNKAMQYIDQAIAITNNTKNKQILTIIPDLYFSKAKIHNALKQFQKCYDLCMITVKMIKQYNIYDDQLKTCCLLTASLAQRNLLQYKKSLELLQKAKTIITQITHLPYEYICILVMQAKNYNDLQEHDKSVQLIRKAINIALQTKWVNNIKYLVNDSTLSESFANTGKTNEGIRIHQDCIKIIKKYFPNNNDLLALHNKQIIRLNNY